MTARSQSWRAVRHPLRLGLRGWRWGRGAVVSPRGTVFVLRLTPAGFVARRRQDFQLDYG